MTPLYTKSGILIAENYTRIVHGGRGDYVLGKVTALQGARSQGCSHRGRAVPLPCTGEATTRYAVAQPWQSSPSSACIRHAVGR